MRKNNLLIFDDFVINPQINTEAYTSTELEAVLGTYDVVAIQLVVDTWSAFSATLVVYQQHSGDAQNWILGNNGMQITSVNTPATLSGVPLTAMGADTSGIPSLGFRRFKIYWTVGAGNAHVRLYATLRDQGA